MDYWNHNVHYQPVILDAVPDGCGAAFDVGCGDGMLAVRLASRCASVTGIDPDARMIGLARDRAPDLTFIEADFLAYAFGDSRFDFACANRVVHHMGTEAALIAMAPGVRYRRHLLWRYSLIWDKPAP